MYRTDSVITVLILSRPFLIHGVMFIGFIKPKQTNSENTLCLGTYNSKDRKILWLLLEVKQHVDDLIYLCK